MPIPPFTPGRGEIWLADLSPVLGHEQSGRLPVLIVSVNAFNQSRAELVIIVPVTSTLRRLPLHVVVQPPEGGLTQASAIMCEAVRSISKDRLIVRWGGLLPQTLAFVDDRLRIVMGL
ncbi:MAG: type II toxin-antitoxin system PemK/MazF family toxin [Verrucomicrobiales bacterium]